MTSKTARTGRRRPDPPTLSGARIVWECLTRERVSHVFGYPGGAILPVYDAMPDYPVHHVLARHEQGAVHMADGFARAGGGVGVAMATSGPGATNMVTGIATAMMDSSPLVCITGQVSSSLIGSDAFQETDITGVTLPVTKHNYLVTEADEIAPALREAFYIARSGRPGPVLVDITKDAQQGTCLFDWAAAEPKPPGYRPDHRPRASDIRHALDLINGASRPVILAGHGVTLGAAEDLLKAFAERTTIPVAMTLLGIGAFPASHPQNLGMMGMHGEAWVNEAVQQADLLVALGMRFDDRVTGKLADFAPRARKIHVEIDPAEVNKNIQVDVGLIGDVREVLETLLPGVVPNDHSAWLARIEDLRRHATARSIQQFDDDGRLYAAHAIHDLWHATGGAALVVTDVGQHQMWEAQYLPARVGALAHHLGRPRPDGIRPAGGHRRQARPPRRRRLGGGRRRRLPDDDGRTRHPGAGGRQGQHRHHQQRLPRHGAAAAGVLLRRALPRDAAGQPRLRRAGGRLRHPRHPRDGARRCHPRGRSGLGPRRARSARHPRRNRRRGLPDGCRRRWSRPDDPASGPGGNPMSSTFVVYVEDKPGVLNRVASLFRRRAFNIESLTVGHTDTPGVSRMTIVVGTDRDGARKVEAHLYKLVNVLRVDDVTATPAVYRDLAMIKVQTTSETRSHIMQLVDVYRARIVDVSPDSLMVEVTGTEDKIDSLLDVLRPYGVLEAVRTGRVAMARGEARTPRARRPSAALRGPMPRIPRDTGRPTPCGCPPETGSDPNHPEHLGSDPEDRPQRGEPWRRSTTTRTRISASSRGGKSRSSATGRRGTRTR